MIPELYDELDNLYTGTGTYWNVDPDVVKANIPSHLIGYLGDTLSCKVTEERNGGYELILTYPMTGKLYSRIYPGQCIMAKANQVDGPQLFRIYRTSVVLRGILTVYARHISYDLSGIDIVAAGLAPQTQTPAGWMLRIFQNTYFKGYSDITATHDLMVEGLLSIRSLLGGVEGSVLDTFGGEYHWDNFEVYLNTARGSNKGIVIEYGKNLTELTLVEENETDYTAIRPFATYTSNDQELTKVGNTISTGYWWGYEWTKILDVTEMLGLDTGVVPTDQQLEDAAQAWWAEQTIGYSNLTVKVVEPSKYATLGLCDTVKVRDDRLVINRNMKVIGLEYDTLLERYTNITLGEPYGNLAATVNDIETAVTALQSEKPFYSKDGKTVDLSGGTVYLSDGTNTSTLTAGIGQRVHSNGSSITLASKTTMTNLNSFTLSKGTWIVSIAVRFNSNATGRRSVSMSDTDSDLSAINVNWGETKNAVNGAYTYLHLCSTVKVTSSSQTYYINAYQNSGGNLDVVAFWDAVRVY